MYTHTQTHVHTDTCTYIHTDTCTHTYMYIHADTCRDTHMYIHTDTCTIVHAYTDTHRHTHMYTYTYTHTHTHHKNVQYFVVHSQVRALHSRRRQRAQHTLLLCFHCAQLLSSLTAPSTNDRSDLSSEPAQQDGPGGHIRPHHNFHSPLVSRRVEISSPAINPI
ncbi:unnamed protein product, partial [Staurois parvus]